MNVEEVYLSGTVECNRDKVQEYTYSDVGKYHSKAREDRTTYIWSAEADTPQGVRLNSAAEQDGGR